MRAMKWFCMGLLVLGCAVGLTACSDDDDGDDDGDAAGNESAGETLGDEEDGTAAVDDADDAPATPVVEDGADEDVAETDAEDDVVMVALSAPQLVWPPDNAYVEDEDVRFQWSAVPGAAVYVLQFNSSRRTVTGTSVTIHLTGDEYQWRVCARDAHGNVGPFSDVSVFRIGSLGPHPL